MKEGCRKTFPYMDVFRSLGWVDASGATTAAAPPLPKEKRKKVRGGIYAELTDSSSDSSSSTVSSKSSSDDDDDASTSSKASKASKGPIKFKAVKLKLTAKTTYPAALAKMADGPRCPVCKEGVLKPDAVYFKEPLPKAIIKEAVNSSKAAKVFLIVGTSGQVAPACKLPLLAKARSAAKVIEISPRETDMSKDADLLLLGSAATVLPALVDAVKRRLAEMPAIKTAEVDNKQLRHAEKKSTSAGAPAARKQSVQKKFLTGPMRKRRILHKSLFMSAFRSRYAARHKKAAHAESS